MYTRSSQYVGPASGQWFGWTFDTPFVYNGVDNLIIEIEWSGDSGGYTYNYWSSATARCVYNYNGGTPYLYNYLHYMRITVLENSGVAPASLGRVKSLFR